MSSMNNRVQLEGHLGADPDLRYCSNGTPVLNFRMATNEGYTKDGKRLSHTEWHRIVVFGKMAESVSKYLQKGSHISLAGHLRTRSWEDKQKQLHYSTEIVVNPGELKFLGKIRSNEQVKGTVAPVAQEELQIQEEPVQQQTVSTGYPF